MTAKTMMFLATLTASSALMSATVWVDKSSQNPVSPYATEATAAASIPDAMVAADALVADGDKAVVVKIKEGEYELTDQFCITNGLTVTGVGDRTKTILRQTTANCRIVVITSGKLGGVTMTGCSVEAVKLKPPVGDAGYGYAVFLKSDNAILTNCVVSGNVSTGTYYSSNPTLHGGTVCTYNGGKVFDCVIANNTTQSPGAGIFSYRGTFVSCTVTNNVTTSIGGGLRSWIGSTIRNCLFADNQAKNYGGAIDIDDQNSSGGTVEDCTIVGNRVTDVGAVAGLYSNSKSIAVRRTLFADNVDGAGVSQDVNYTASKVSYTKCLLPTNAEGRVTMTASSSGNLYATPSFIDDSPYMLAQGSAGIDAGDTSVSRSHDLGGRARVVDGNGDGVALSDIGCWEFDPVLDGTVFSASRTSAKYVQVGESVSFATVFRYRDSDVVGATYEWDFGDGTTESGTGSGSVTHAYAEPGCYSVTVSATKGKISGSAVLQESVRVFAADKRTLWVTPNGEHVSDTSLPTNAIAVAKELIAGGEPSVRILIAPGTYDVWSGQVLDAPIEVIGAEGADKTVFKAKTGNQAITMITLAHPEAVFGGVTITGIDPSWDNRWAQAVGAKVESGTISNCVIRGIHSIWFYNQASHGCALTMTGGKAVGVVVTNNVSYSDECRRNGSPVRLSGTALMDRCIVRGNSCTSPYGAWLKGIYRNRKDELAGGGVYLASGTPVCRNTLIVGNRTISQPGAGAYVVAGTLENCTVVGNYMTSSTNAAWSSGIYAWPGAKIVNCISDANMNGSSAINAGGEDGIDPTAVFRYSCLPGYGFGGAGCTTVDPLLDADYRPTAPETLGAGKNAEWMKTALDLAGNPRKQGSRVDMGCYECDATVKGLMVIVR